MKTKKKHSPMSADSINKACSLRRDNASYGDFWILTDGYRVTICKQKPGFPPEQQVTIPRGLFNNMVRFYTKPTSSMEAK